MAGKDDSWDDEVETESSVAKQQQVSHSFSLDCLTLDKMDTKLKEDSLSAAALLLASKS